MQLHAIIPQVQFFPRPSKEGEPVVGKAWAKMSSEGGGGENGKSLLVPALRWR
jgi:hypothetical protein